MSLIQLKEGEQITSKVIADLISDHKTAHDRMITQYSNYMGDDLPISKRTFDDDTKINRKVNADYRGEIVNQLIGFMFGKPVTYTLTPTIPEANKKYFVDFMRANAFDNLDLETGKRSSIMGTCPRILYVDKLGKERVMYVAPWEVIFIYDQSLDQPQYALRYYTVIDATPSTPASIKIDVPPSTTINRYITKVEWYDSKNVTFYTNEFDGQFVLDGNQPVNPMPHLYDGVPVIEFENNDDRQSDFYKATNAIDSYDRAVSDAQNEIEEFRNAYMVFLGCGITTETLQAARQTGAFTFPRADASKASVGYLAKDFNPQQWAQQIKILRDDIYRFSSTVDITSENFTGSGASGETRKWLLFALEVRASIRQMKFSKSLYNMFKVLSTLWVKKGIAITENDVFYEFDRLYPQELLLEAEILDKLEGKVSKRTQLSVFSPVRDVDKELKDIEAEKEKEPKLNTVPAVVNTNEQDKEE